MEPNIQFHSVSSERAATLQRLCYNLFAGVVNTDPCRALLFNLPRKAAALDISTGNICFMPHAQKTDSHCSSAKQNALEQRNDLQLRQVLHNAHDLLLAFCSQQHLPSTSHAGLKDASCCIVPVLLCYTYMNAHLMLICGRGAADHA